MEVVMIKPSIHLNGTPAERLLDQYCDAGKAIRQAIDALNDARPNPRDYYPQGDNAYATAAKEQEARLDKLREVLADMVALADYVQEEQDRREARRRR
jgi:hypothetical protein